MEQFNRTLKGRMYRYFTARGTEDYVFVLPALVNGYNKSRHRSIGMAPKDVTETSTMSATTSASQSRTKSRSESETSTVQERLSARLDQRSVCRAKGRTWTGDDVPSEGMGRPTRQGQFYEEDLQPIIVPDDVFSCVHAGSPLEGLAQQVRQLDSQFRP